MSVINNCSQTINDLKIEIFGNVAILFVNGSTDAYVNINKYIVPINSFLDARMFISGLLKHVHVLVPRLFLSVVPMISIFPDQIPYHTYAQYDIFWSLGNEILSEVDEVDCLPSED